MDLACPLYQGDSPAEDASNPAHTGHAIVLGEHGVPGDPAPAEATGVARRVAAFETLS